MHQEPQIDMKKTFQNIIDKLSDNPLGEAVNVYSLKKFAENAPLKLFQVVQLI